MRIAQCNIVHKNMNIVMHVAFILKSNYFLHFTGFCSVECITIQCELHSVHALCTVECVCTLNSTLNIGCVQHALMTLYR